SGYNPLMFLDTLFPIKSVVINGTTESRDSSNSNPNFWGGITPAYSGTLTCVLTSYETSVGSVTVTVNGSSISPVQVAPPGTTSGQFNTCVVGPTYTFTNTPTKTLTPIPGTATFTPTITNTFTNTFTVTATKTATPLSGCPYYNYSGASPHALANIKTWTGVNGTSSSLTESAAAALNGEAMGLNFQAAVSATGYYAGIGLNWANYAAAPAAPYQPLVNLNNFTTLQFYIQNNNAAASPMTLTVALVDYQGGAAYTSTPVTFSITGTGANVVNFPLSSFSTGGASYTKTNIGEIDIAIQATAAAQSENIYVGSLAFYGTCPTNTPTPTNTFTYTPTSTLTSTPTKTSTFTFTSTPTITNTFTPTPSSTSTATKTNTPANTSTSTATNTSTASSTPTSTASPTKT